MICAEIVGAMGFAFGGVDAGLVDNCESGIVGDAGIIGDSGVDF